MKFQEIEKHTNDILDRFGITSIPVPVKEVAQEMGIIVRPYDLGDDVYGVLILDTASQKAMIGYNPKDPVYRQRFTIAHELGHFELHKDKQSFFMDNHFKIQFRSKDSSTKEYFAEQQANAFAAALLMPEKLLIKEINRRHIDLADEKGFKELAKNFNVSMAAMSFRISNLNLYQKLDYLEL